jgi:hypothetical protein
VIVSGLRAGDRVVVEGMLKVVPGQPVQIAQAGTADAQAGTADAQAGTAGAQAGTAGAQPAPAKGEAPSKPADAAK